MTTRKANKKSVDKQATQQATYFNQKQLLDRGWSRTLIKNLLGESDATAVNPYYKSGPPILRFLCERAKEAEQNSLFQKHLAKREDNLATAKRALQTKTAKTLSWAEGIAINLPIWDHDSLIKLAVENYNAHKDERDNGYGEDHAMVSELRPFGETDEFRDRICVNFLRHEATVYDNALAHNKGKVGSSQAHEIIFRKVIEKIAEAYPMLADEAERQFLRRFAHQI